ncbi:hypothetical protein F9K33_12065 [bacterium]|nr:MAG: hypothetical protein F9K33_12065 [bacterium]
MKNTTYIIFSIMIFAACDSKEKELPVKWNAYTLNNSALINNYVLCVTVDSDDHVWTGNFYGDVTEFDGKLWTHHTTTNPAPFNRTVYTIAVDHFNTIWAATDSGLFHFENGSLPSIYSGSRIQDIAVASDNSIWTCTPYVNKLDPEYNWTPFNLYGDHIAIARNSYVWLCSYGQIVELRGQNSVIYRIADFGVPNQYLLDIAVDDNNVVWIGTNKSGLVRFNGTGWAVYDTANSGLPSNQIQTIAFDKEDHMWIGTDLGVAYYDNTQWVVYNTENSGLSSNNITGIAFDKKNNVWIATFGGGLNVFNPNGL